MLTHLMSLYTMLSRVGIIRMSRPAELATPAVRHLGRSRPSRTDSSVNPFPSPSLLRWVRSCCALCRTMAKLLLAREAKLACAAVVKFVINGFGSCIHVRPCAFAESVRIFAELQSLPVNVSTFGLREKTSRVNSGDTCEGERMHQIYTVKGKDKVKVGRKGKEGLHPMPALRLKMEHACQQVQVEHERCH